VLEAIVDVALRAILASVLLGGVLVLAVLAATRWLSLSASTRHALWTIALIATAVMPLAGVGVSLARGMAPQPAVVVNSSAVIPGPVPANIGSPRTHPDASSGAPAHRAATAARPSAYTFPTLRFSFMPRLSREPALAVVGVWLAGALIGLAGLVASIVRVRGLKRRSSPLEGDLADELPWLTDITAGREIYLRLSFETETPVAIGFRRPVILIPTELASAAGLAAIESLILHEHAHLRRYDDWTNLVQRTIERVFWFNPLVWLVGRRIALEREIASDDAVVEKTGAAHEYATSLWRLAREMRMPEHAVVAPGALLTRKQISVRIELLLDKNRARLHRSPAAAFGIVVAGLLAVAFVATSAPAVELPAPAPLAVAPLPVAPLPFAPSAVSLSAVSTSSPAPSSPATSAPRVRIVVHDSPKVRHPRIVIVERIPTGAAPMPSLDVAAIVHDALADLPKQIAQEGTGTAHGSRSLAGMKPTRELIATCTACSLRDADLRGLDLHGLVLVGDSMRGADLRGTNLAGTRLTGVSLRGANLSTADLRGAVLTGVELREANFDGALLDDVRLNGVSFRGVSVRGTALRSVITNCTGCDFSRMDLHGQDLHGITLTGANFSRADLRDANLANVRFTGVDFSHADLTGADLTGASLSGCDLAGVSLHGAKTAGMTLQGTGLDG
jgi:uncharacterized protein YjbI with pentapeptide repeats/beta-lactamase regulating signal transducer with metallopeptidase domain